MVSPQNPLKPTSGMAPFDARLAGAEALATHPAIAVTDIEQRLGTRYTADTLAALNFCFPRMHFVWIMGADNLVQVSQWQRWTRIFNLAPIAVFDRAPYSFDALAGQAAQAFSRFKIRAKYAHKLVETRPPAWSFFHTRLHPASATEIRAGRTLFRVAGAANGGSAMRQRAVGAR